MLFRAVNTQRIYEEIVTQIKDAVENGQFRPGDRLPSERELAEMFGVGRTSVREALRALEAEGLIVTRQGQGTFIAQKEISGFADHFAELLMQYECTPLQILEARCGVEISLARLAATKRTQEHLKKMACCLEEMRSLIDAGKSPTAPDQRFHKVVAEASGNLILITIFENILDFMQQPQWLDSKEDLLKNAEISRKYFAQHVQIYEAIRQQMPDEAALFMKAHLDAIYSDQLLKRLEKQSHSSDRMEPVR